MRIWTLLVNYGQDGFAGYLDELHKLLSDVTLQSIDYSRSQDSVLITVEYSTLPSHKDARIVPKTCNALCAFTGWVNDTARGRIYSALRRDSAPEQCGSDTFLGEFSYAALGPANALVMTDHYATHPIYYCKTNCSRWIVSTDLRALLIAPGCTFEPCVDACNYFLSGSLLVGENELPSGRTFFRGVSKVLPNTKLLISISGDTWRTVCKTNVLNTPFKPLRGLDQTIEYFRETLNACVRDRIVAGADGLLLSGGVDSSSVLGACMAAQPENLPHSVTIGFRDTDLGLSQDEMLVASLIEATRASHEFVYVDPCLRLLRLDDACAFVDGPVTAANPLSLELCAQVFQRRNVHMVMTGEGADAILGEEMHESILDSIKKFDGIRAVWVYLNKNLEITIRSPRFAWLLASSISRGVAQIELERRARSLLDYSLPRFIRNRTAPLSAAAFENAGPSFIRDPESSFVAHTLCRSMLFPRASYFDALNIHCQHSHPFLDPRMIRLALSVPPHLQHDYRSLKIANPYASAKAVARRAYEKELPAIARLKQFKTSYALMARKMFQNSARYLYQVSMEPMRLDELGLIDKKLYRKHLLSYIFATEDPNAMLGAGYHFIRGVGDLEVWLRRFSSGSALSSASLKFQPLRRF